MLLLDTNPLVDFLKGQGENIRGIILESEQGREQLTISAVTISELFYVLAREQGIEFSKACIENIKAHIEAISLDEKIAERAGELKFKYAGGKKRGLPLADYIMAATAMENDATLLTKDAYFKKIKELKVRCI